MRLHVKYITQNIRYYLCKGPCVNMHSNMLTYMHDQSTNETTINR